MLVSPNKYILLLLLLAANSFASAAVLQGVRIHEAPDSTRVVFDTNLLVEYEVFSLDNPNRIVVDLIGVKPESGFDPSVVAMGRARISDIRTSQRGDTYRLVIDTKQKLLPEAFALKPIKPYGHRLVVDLLASVKTPVKPSIPVAKNRDVIIAIDAGHGGDDPGAIGPKRIQEKRVVLQIAKRIAKKINAITGFTAVLVRTGDYYLPHRKRTQIARQKRADLFLSIHADAFKHANVRGASVYTLSDRGASSETAAWLAERENRSDLLGGVGNVSLTDKDVVLAHVLLDLSMDANRLQSIEMGEAILASMGRITKLHKRTVEQAAFVVLKSPDMPSILVETGFISNPQEAKRLSQAEHQDKIARAISTGVEQFMRISPPPGTLLASRVGEMRYTIVRGDTLSRIAQQYGVSSRALKSKNGLRSDSIRVGQVIVIPTGG
ncbi:MAG: AMIN domain-containing protein [Gammaproteobacteria bacterium]|nr:AMIN domain-containing protein [Gammaproteobacteria bacterium]